jgi:hypothetical protein
MSHNLPLALPLLAALAILGGAATTASAQTAPQPDSQGRAAVREILNRAESESRRRSVGEILGGIAGISQAAAQAAPPAAPQSPAPAASQPPAVAIGAAQSAPAAHQPPAVVAPANQPPQPAAGPRTQSTTAAAPTAPPTGSGTPADPSVIATAPAPGSSGAEPAPQGGNGAALDPVAPNAPNAGAPVVASGDGPRTVIVQDGPRHREFRFVGSREYNRAPVWCAPYRW